MQAQVADDLRIDRRDQQAIVRRDTRPAAAATSRSKDTATAACRRSPAAPGRSAWIASASPGSARRTTMGWPAAHDCARQRGQPPHRPFPRVPSTVAPGAAMSAVRCPWASTRRTAASIRSPTSGPRERIAEHHRRRQDRRQRIGQVLAGDVRARSRGSARTGPCCLHRARPTAACRSSRPASTPRRTGCRRTCCR